MISLSDIDRRIRELTGEDPEARPFLCDGSPLGCEVFLVGINPGVNIPFWPYWRLPFGCHREEWLRECQRRFNRFIPTRARIERLIAAMHPVRCLETNIYSHVSPNEKALSAKYRDTGVFDFLLEALQPKVLFVHGMEGIHHMEQLTGRSLPREEFIRAEIRGLRVWVVVGKHLSRGWSYAKVDGLGEKLREVCRAEGCAYDWPRPGSAPG